MPLLYHFVNWLSSSFIVAEVKVLTIVAVAAVAIGHHISHRVLVCAVVLEGAVVVLVGLAEVAAIKVVHRWCPFLYAYIIPEHKAVVKFQFSEKAGVFQLRLHL